MITASAPETSAVRIQKPMLTGYFAPSSIQIRPPDSRTSSKVADGFLPTKARISGAPSELSFAILHKSFSEPSITRISDFSAIEMISSTS